MNIFYLDHDPAICAQYHCDKHVVKMILEYAQLLSTAHHVLDNTDNAAFYRATHINHPSAKWVRQSTANYLWLVRLFRHLCNEYTHRYGKTHKTFTRLNSAIGVLPNNLPRGEFTQPTPAMPQDVEGETSLDKYREYYRTHKYTIASWKRRKTPEWFKI